VGSRDAKLIATSTWSPSVAREQLRAALYERLKGGPVNEAQLRALRSAIDGVGPWADACNTPERFAALGKAVNRGSR
jgi:hypothetical protein